MGCEIPSLDETNAAGIGVWAGVAGSVESDVANDTGEGTADCPQLEEILVATMGASPSVVESVDADVVSDS